MDSPQTKGMLVTRIRALNYRCLRHVDVPLGNFHLLAGPNESGKSTFLDVLNFLRDFVGSDLDGAAEGRSLDSLDLVWNRDKGRAWFEFALEFDIPEGLRPDEDSGRFEYVVRFALDKYGDIRVEKEQGSILGKAAASGSGVPETLFQKSGRRKIFVKDDTGTGRLFSERRAKSDRRPAAAWRFSYGSKRSVLGNLPADDSRFAISARISRFLATGVQAVRLDPDRLRNPGDPQTVGFATGNRFANTGADLAAEVLHFRNADKEGFGLWIRHLRVVLKELRGIEAVEKPVGCLVLEYGNGNRLRLPSWAASDGTLRFIALTLLAYSPSSAGKAFLIEEPENGIHPRAMQAVFDSLSSAYHSQLLLATHSPVFLQNAGLKELLCCTRGEDGSTAIVQGSRHPRLREWNRQPSLGDLFAAGVLG